MKKIIAVIIAVVSVLALAACNKDNVDILTEKITEAIVDIAETATDIKLNVENDVTAVTEKTQAVILSPIVNSDDKVKPIGNRNGADNIAVATADFGFELFEYTLKNGGNSLVSPVSVMAALAMTADGADGQTLAETEAVLGMKNEALRKYYGGYVHPASSDESLKFANSLWLKNKNFTVNKNFVDRTVEAYGAEVYAEPFDAETVKKINFWISRNTDGKINKMLDEIPAEAVSYIINTVLFDAKWETAYKESGVRDNQIFVASDGEIQYVTMLSSEEAGGFTLGKTQGFIKNYQGGKYAFVGLLPDEGVSLENALASFSGEDFVNAVKAKKQGTVMVSIPKFSYDCKFLLNEPLISMGMPTAFSSSGADFSKLGTSPNGNIYIGRVLHNSFITYSEQGTVAGAATVVEFVAEGMMEIKNMHFNRPFIYAIVDKTSGMPIFIGAVNNLK